MMRPVPTRRPGQPATVRTRSPRRNSRARLGVGMRHILPPALPSQQYSLIVIYSADDIVPATFRLAVAPSRDSAASRQRGIMCDVRQIKEDSDIYIYGPLRLDV